jgi:mTERF domain-containing protein
MSRWGWSEDDVLSAFRKFPQCMIMSEKKIMQVMDCLVNKMGWPSGMVAKNPVVMGFSLEKRIIPRCCASSSSSLEYFLVHLLPFQNYLSSMIISNLHDVVFRIIYIAVY